MKITVPDNALPYIRLQRTTLNLEDLKDSFSESIQDDFDGIKSFLPESCSAILDIGCGVAGINVPLSQFYEDPVHITLLDKTHTEEEVKYGYKTTSEFYNSLEVAKTLLMDNNIEEKNITLLNAQDDHQITSDGPFDIIISLLSMGFHYPVTTYLDRILETLSPNGVLILDIRKNTNDLAIIKQHFNKVEMIVDTLKWTRYCASME